MEWSKVAVEAAIYNVSASRIQRTFRWRYKRRQILLTLMSIVQGVHRTHHAAALHVQVHFRRFRREKVQFILDEGNGVRAGEGAGETDR